MSRVERTPARREVDAALADDRAAFAEWWQVLEKRFRQPGIAERLFARAFAAGRAVGRTELTPPVFSFDPGPAGYNARRNG